MDTRRCARLVALSVLVVSLSGSLALQAAPVLARPFLPERLLLFLDGQFAGSPATFDGGAIVGDVAQYSAGDECFARNIIRGVKYEDIQTTSRIPLPDELYDWVSSSLTCEPGRRDGQIAAASFDQNVLWAKEFHNALISEIGLPALDAASKQPGFLEVGISSEGINRTSAVPGGPQPLTKGKSWISSNFSVSIPGLDTTAIRRVEIPKVLRKITEYREGGSTAVHKIPGRLEFPNIVVTLPLSRAASWIAWHEDFVINGNSGAGNEKQGVISLLGPDLQTELARIVLHGLGIVQVEPVTGDPGPPMARAVLYCTSLEYQQP